MADNYDVFLYTLTINYKYGYTCTYQSTHIRQLKKLAGVGNRAISTDNLNTWVHTRNYDSLLTREFSHRRPGCKHKNKPVSEDIPKYPPLSNEEHHQLANDYWSKRFNVHLDSLIKALESGDLTLSDIIPKDISDLH